MEGKWQVRERNMKCSSSGCWVLGGSSEEENFIASVSFMVSKSVDKSTPGTQNRFPHLHQGEQSPEEQWGVLVGGSCKGSLAGYVCAGSF